MQGFWRRAAQIYEAALANQSARVVRIFRGCADGLSRGRLQTRSGFVPAAGRSRGRSKKYSFANSKIFPGTVRNYWIYVPRHYDPAKPACLYVNQDGVQFK